MIFYNMNTGRMHDDDNHGDKQRSVRNAPAWVVMAMMANTRLGQ